MNLLSITIKNYRSIDELVIKIDELKDNTYTYGLIGVNEAGKSTILRAIALKDGLVNSDGIRLPLQKDFRDKQTFIDVYYRYFLMPSEVKQLTDKIKSAVPSFTSDMIDLRVIELNIYSAYANASNTFEDIDDKHFKAQESEKDSIKDVILKYVVPKAHRTVFWTAESQYLITKAINLTDFANHPDKISIPLKNCFSLAGMSNADSIKERIDLIGDSTERESLKEDLSEAVTKHINAVWKDHPIRLSFDISDGLIFFHVHDLKAKGKAKTTDQRSDGFGQFISFLLTISAQNKNKELSNTILLIDEPETHLHPRAQEDLLNELITITNNGRNNIVFFATHSNYMIDKLDLSRNYKVVKSALKDKASESTQIERFTQAQSTYASVTYEVFDIASSDYHSELFSKLHELYQKEDTSDSKRILLKNFDDNYLSAKHKLKQNKPWKGSPNSATLPTYIRNCINHPDNGDTYKADDLRESINILKNILEAS